MENQVARSLHHLVSSQSCVQRQANPAARQTMHRVTAGHFFNIEVGVACSLLFEIYYCCNQFCAISF